MNKSINSEFSFRKRRLKGVAYLIICTLILISLFTPHFERIMYFAAQGANIILALSCFTPVAYIVYFIFWPTHGYNIYTLHNKMGWRIALQFILLSAYIISLYMAALVAFGEPVEQYKPYGFLGDAEWENGLLGNVNRGREISSMFSYIIISVIIILIQFFLSFAAARYSDREARHEVYKQMPDAVVNKAPDFDDNPFENGPF